VATNPTPNPKPQDKLKPIEVSAEGAAVQRQPDWKTIQQKWGVYPPQAYAFLREGLQFTSDKLHGAEESSGIPEDSRHVTGSQLSAGLRDFAINRYGLLARTVLGSWNVNSTEDFGRMVFALLDLGVLRRRDEDQFEDFIDVFGFDDAFADLASLASQDN
jgi:hypothetical protein